MMRAALLSALLILSLVFSPPSFAQEASGPDSTGAGQSPHQAKPTVQLEGPQAIGTAILTSGAFISMALEGGKWATAKVIEVVREDEEPIRYRLGDKDGNPLPEETIRDVRRIDTSAGTLLITAITGDPTDLVMEFIRVATLGLEDILNETVWETVDEIWQTQRLYGSAEIDGQKYNIEAEVKVGYSGDVSSVLVRFDVFSVQPKRVFPEGGANAEIALSFGPLELRNEEKWNSFSQPTYFWIQEIEDWGDIESELRNNPIQGRVFVKEDPLFWFEEQIGSVDLLPDELAFPPPRPELAATSNQNSVSLSIEGSGDSFEIYRSAQSGFSVDGREPLATIPGTVYEDNEILPGKKYYYKTVAVSSVGKKSNSSEQVSGRAKTNLRLQNLSLGDTPVRARSEAVITGKVETTEGDPVGDADVTLTIPKVDWTYESISTNADGTFTLPYRVPLKKGSYQAQLTAQSQESVRVQSKNLDVVSPADAGRDLRVDNLAVEDSVVQAGGVVQSTLELTNSGIQSEQAQLTYEVLDRSGNAVTTGQRNVSISSGSTTELFTALTLPAGLSTGGYLLEVSATNSENLDERWADNVARRDIYVASEEALSGTYETQRDTLFGVGESVDIGGTTVTLAGVENSNVTFEVGGESTGALSVGELWLNDPEDFLLTPKSIASIDTVVAIRGGPATGEAEVAPNRQVTKRGHEGTYQVQTPEGSNIQLPSLSIVSGSEAETLQAWNENAPNVLVDANVAELNLLVPPDAEIGDYSGWLRWSDGEHRYFKRLALRSAPIHDFQLSDLQIDNGTSVSTHLPGMDIEVSATATNWGDFTEDVDVALKVTTEDSVVYREAKTLQLTKRPTPPESGGEVEAALTWPTVGLEQGTYDVQVSLTHSEDETPNNDRLTTTTELTEPQPLTVDVLESPKVYEPGDTIRVQASVTQEGEAIPGASAYALVTRPDGSTEEVSMFYDAQEEIYEGYLFADFGGNYDTRVTANQRFARQGSDRGMARAYVDVSVSSAFSSLLFSRRGGVTLSVSNVGGLYGVAADITYDGALVDFKEARELSFLSQGGEVETSLVHSDEEGRVITGLTRLDPGAGGATTPSRRRLLSLSFAGIANGSASFSLENVQITDAEGDTMAVRLEPSGATSFEISPREAALVADTRDTTATLSETDTTDLVISNAYNLQGVDGKITFDPSKVEVEDIIEGTALERGDEETLFVTNIDNESGEAEFAVSRQGDRAGISTGADQVARILYRPTSTGTVQFDWSRSGLVAAENELGIPHFTSGDSIRVTPGDGTSDSARVSFSPSELSPAQGETFTLAATVENVSDLFSVATSISFDPTQLDTVALQEGDFLSEGGEVSTSFTNQVNEETGTITIGLSRLGTDVGGVSTMDPDTLFTLRFTRTGEGQSIVEYFDTGLLLPDGETEIPFQADKATLARPLRVSRPIPDDTLRTPGPVYQFTSLDRTVFGGTGDETVFVATSSAPSVVGIAESNSQGVALEANSPGTAEVTVTASNGRASTSTAFTATVVNRPEGAEVPIEHATALVDTVEEEELEVEFGETGTEAVFEGIAAGGTVEVGFFREDSTSTGTEIVASVDTFEDVSHYKWKILNQGVAYDSVDVEFVLGDTSVTGIGAPQNVQILGREEGSETFQPVRTQFSDQGTPEDSTDDRLIAKEVLNLGTFKFASNDPSNPLPVQLTSFEAELDGGGVLLTWQTASEQRNAGFEVQRRVVGANGTGRASGWKKIGFVKSKAANGTTSKPHSYRLNDKKLPHSANQLSYRLRQVDLSGAAKLIDPITVERKVQEVELLPPAPNPARSRSKIRYSVPDRQKVSLRLYDVLGRQVSTIAQGKVEGRQATTINVSSLPSGIYFLRLDASGKVRTRRLTIVQ